MLVRVLEGTLRQKQKVMLWAKQREYEVQELAVNAPKARPVKELMAGEVGLLVANIKEIADAKVGDTVTDAKEQTETPFPGFKEMKPMVFSGIYPVDAADYENLRDALAKLRLNDSSFTVEPETSQALGFGFRCGYLGLLHMEIVQERLEREYNLNLITTAPSVVYRLTTTAGEVLLIDNPAKLPPVQNISKFEEPIFTSRIHVPEEYVGAVLKLCQDRRGVQKDLKYFGTKRVQVTYEMPLAEVVFDFFDKLKSVSRLRAQGLPGRRPRQARHSDQRRAGRRAHHHRPPGPRLRPRTRGVRQAQGSDPAADVRGGHPGRHRDQGHRADHREGLPEERHRQVLRRRHQPQAQAPREAEGRQEAHEAGRLGGDPAGGLPRGAQDRVMTETRPLPPAQGRGAPP
jgi:hypothetical protein